MESRPDWLTPKPVMWRISDIPDGWAGSLRVAPNTWASKCRECGLLAIDHGVHAKPRYIRGSIGWHEYEKHGLDVVGINVAILP